LSNTIVSKFTHGVRAGQNASFLFTESSFIGLTGGDALVATNPRYAYVNECQVYKSESNGFTILLNVKTPSELIRKISLLHNRFYQIIGTAIQVESSFPSTQYAPYCI
jgi:hypothetical protein